MSCDETVEVSAACGRLRGRRALTVWGLPYCSFQGVPYAKPPLGPLRFKEPQTLERWAGTRDALHEGPSAVSVDPEDFSKPVGSEDCLYLNVYTPQLEMSACLAVMVWIHGGGFVWGSGGTACYGPDILLGGGVLLVTCNYRLGVLGFLSTGDSIVSGNMGLKDQVAVLQWVQNNIASFGGDPNNVTIFGESAGAASVNYHLLSPLSKGLFHKAIMQSGSALSTWAFAESVRERSFRLGEVLGYSTTDSEQLIEFLRGIDAHKLVEVFPQVVPEHEQMGALTVAFVPCIEEEHPGSFLTEDPLLILTEQRFHRVPLIIGGTSGEGIAFLALTGILNDGSRMDFMINNFETVFGSSFLIKNSQTCKVVAQQIKSFYFNNPKEDQYSSLVKMVGDLHFNVGADIVARLISSATNPPAVYRYYFSFESSLALISKMVDHRFSGATHTADLCYLFWFSDGRQDARTDSDQHNVRTIMTTLWSNFAKMGLPTQELNHLLQEQWLQYTPDNHIFADINQKLRMRTDINCERYNFWWKKYYPSRLQSLHAECEEKSLLKNTFDHI